MTLDELIYDVEQYITVSGSLPKILPRLEIERIIENEAKPYFSFNYFPCLQKEYIYIPSHIFQQEEFTNYNYVTLPCRVQNVVWLYMVENRSLFNLGVSSPNLSIDMGTTNQPYLSSSLSSIGELGIYKVILGGFSDMLNQLSKDTLKNDFNTSSKQLNILTNLGHSPYSNTNKSVVAEVYSIVEDEDLFDFDLFRRYVRAKTNIQLGRILARYDYTSPGGVKINSDLIMNDGKEELQAVLDEIKENSSNAGFFFMTKR